MSRFEVSRDTLGTHPIAVLRDTARDRRVRIARRGATVLGIQARHAGEVVELADGYRSARELEQRSGSRFAVMAPFANRVADAAYLFQGVPHDLQPGATGAARAARHGFVRDADFELAALAADAEAAWVELRTTIGPDDHPGYPFAIDLAVRYVLNAAGLTVEARMRNTGATAAPCFFGWHPYFRLADEPVDDWLLQVPAATLIAADADFIPLPAAAAHQPVAQAPGHDLRRSQPIGPRQLNHAYADLLADPDGRCRSWLRHPGAGPSLAVWQEEGVLLAFTADTVDRDARRSLALEPMQSLANAFNRPDCTGAITLPAGASRLFRCGVDIHTRENCP